MLHDAFGLLSAVNIQVKWYSSTIDFHLLSRDEISWF
jgi:hypothetical protein